MTQGYFFNYLHQQSFSKLHMVLKKDPTRSITYPHSPEILCDLLRYSSPFGFVCFMENGMVEDLNVILPVLDSIPLLIIFEMNENSM